MSLTTASIFAAAIVTVVLCNIPVPVAINELPTEQEPRYPQRMYASTWKPTRMCTKYACKPEGQEFTCTAWDIATSNPKVIHRKRFTQDVIGIYKTTEYENLRVLIFNFFNGTVQRHRVIENGQTIADTCVTKEEIPPQDVLDKVAQVCRGADYTVVDHSQCKVDHSKCKKE